MNAFKIYVGLCATLQAQREDARDDGDLAERQTVRHVGAATELAVVDRHSVNTRLATRITEQARLAFRDDLSIWRGQLHYGIELGANRSRDRLYADFLTGLCFEAEAINVTGLADHANDRRRERHSLARCGRVVRLRFIHRLEEIDGECQRCRLSLGGFE